MLGDGRQVPIIDGLIKGALMGSHGLLIRLDALVISHIAGIIGRGDAAGVGSVHVWVPER
jgi:hypothetical protein